MEQSISVSTVESDPVAAVQKGQPKALRFVTNYGAPHPKRRRIGAACLTCRKRKTACSGERPFCETCKQTSQDCAGYSTDAIPPIHKRTTSEPSKSRPSDIGDNQVRLRKSQSVKQEGEGDGVELPHKSRSRADVQPTSQSALAPETDAQDGPQGQDALFSGPRNRMPYFRWLGPTAIMPGYKQMVVKVKRHDTDVARSSTDGMQSPSLNNHTTIDQRGSSSYSNAPAAVESDVRTPLSLPFYDTSPMPPSELITHLANTFFTHLGCNYPFLQRERFLRDLEEKQVDAILVDAVCALAARFSTHSLLTQQLDDEVKATPAEYGHAFARRAQTALPDTFSCPIVAAVQAALLLAYNEFGESRDSGLWMYLGTAIRMAEDLGMHKLEGLKYKGRSGPTPKQVKREPSGGGPVTGPGERASRQSVEKDDDGKVTDERMAVEQERVDTFWAVFFLDRVVSSGTGRRSTLRDKDIEISFPSLDETDPKSGWPAPFPALIRIVHLYGRVADLLNSIKEPSDINSDTSRRLASMESQVTNFYQGLSPRLHFDAVNFQNYMKAGEGTNFVLLHFWFHTLIVLLHQPTLLKTFEGGMLQLLPNSQQLSMSSAKTIADILSYSQLMDAKASLGNPFTTQPIYIAACAFLKETAEQTATSSAQSRANSPIRRENSLDSASSTNGTPRGTNKRPSVSSIHPNAKPGSTPTDQRVISKHTLLATAASQHYQLCYKALQSLETYWAGTKYILTILDQKFAGVSDPLLYTIEESESSIEQPKPEPAFTSPGWRRKLSWGPYLGSANPFLRPSGLGQVPGSPSVNPSKAIGWTLTGTMDSPNTNLAWHYSSGADIPQGNASRHDDLAAPECETNIGQPSIASGVQYPQHLRTASSSSAYVSGQETMTRPSTYPTSSSQVSNADADLLLGLGSPYNQPNGSSSHQRPASGPGLSYPLDTTGYPTPTQTNNALPFPFYTGQVEMQNFGDMLIESQDVDMSMLGLDMMPWFDSYPTHDVIGMFDTGEVGNGSARAGAQEAQQHAR